MPVLFESHPPSGKKTPIPKKIPMRYNSTPLTAFVIHPKDIRFDTQEPDEEVVLFLRQHIIVLLPKLAIGILFFIAPLIVFPFILRFLSTPIEIPPGYVIVGTMFWYIALFGFVFTQFLQWYFNIFIVTNRRIIDIDFLYLLYKKFGEAQLARVQDISYRSSGIMATMFNYGDVLIQTAAEVPNLIFESVPRPNEVVDVISNLTKMKGRRGGREY
jgi:hypothetical protein